MAGGSRRRRREEASRDSFLTQELTSSPVFEESQWPAGMAEPSGTGFGSHASQEYDRLNQQNVDDDEEKYLVGFVEVNVVGLQYYHGTVNNREMVRLIREPHNAYDRNAIRVENMWGEQVGHVERYKACYLAPLADQDNVAIEGIVPHGSRNVYRMPCQVFVFSTYPTMAAVLSQLRHSGLNVITPSDSHFEHLAAMAPDEKGKDAPEQTKSVDDIFDSLLLNRTKIPPAMDPSAVITTGLYLHQREALAWLVGRENSGDLPPFWEEQADKRGGGRPSYVNTLTNFMTNQKPEPFRGGILADEMGLGKTLTLISLIATNKTSLNEVEAVERLTKQKKLEHLGFPAVSTKTKHSNSESTLVVCPLSVISMWVTQLEEHTRSGSLNVYLYHGPERTKKASFLSSFDIVLTTYNILAAEGEDSWSPLQKVNWFRVILDEAHLVKNPNAQMTKAAISLTAERRWAVTGTPIQNGAKDLCSLMMFLKLQPLDDRSFWNRTIQRPLLNGETCGFLRLQALLMAIALRRTKDMMVNGKRLVELPKKTITVCNVDLSEDDRRLYDKVEFEGKRLVGQYVESGTVLQNYTTILQIILRLRQICDHSSLCPLQESMLDTLPSAADLSSSPELLEKLLSALQSGDDFDCPICLSPPTMAIITKCSHIFCRRCIEKTLMHDKQSCPLCRAPLTAADLFSSVTQSVDTPASDTKAPELSAKIKALLEMLEESRRNDTAIKSVVFSQFSSMLTLVQGALETAGFQCVRLDGSMPLKKREQALKAFQSNDSNSPSIFLLSLKAAGVGLNLVAASRVYMLDPWWNPAVEEQAMDRVHRLGQTHDVEVVRFIVKESIEERILQLQERKRNLANSAFEESPEQMRKTRVQDVQRLMQL